MKKYIITAIILLLMSFAVYYTVTREKEPEQVFSAEEIEEIRGKYLKAVKESDKESLKLLLEKYPQQADGVYTGGKTLLRLAIALGDADILELLINSGAVDINVKDVDGFTPLMAGAIRQNENTVRLLISAGADINAKDNKGNTAVFRALYMNNAEILEMMIYAGADMDVANVYGTTPMMIAEKSGLADTVKALIKKRSSK